MLISLESHRLNNNMSCCNKKHVFGLFTQRNKFYHICCCPAFNAYFCSFQLKKYSDFAYSLKNQNFLLNIQINHSFKPYLKPKVLKIQNQYYIINKFQQKNPFKYEWIEAIKILQNVDIFKMFYSLYLIKLIEVFWSQKKIIKVWLYYFSVNSSILQKVHFISKRWLISFH
jgi:hypothetical protein